MPEHGGMARAGLEPHINDVHFLAELFTATLFALRSRRKYLSGLVPIPRVGAFLREQLHHFPVHFGRAQQFVALAVAAQKYCDGDSPDALPRDAPVRPCLDHIADAQLAPLWIPLHVLDLFQRSRPQRSAFYLAVHRDEPLFGRAEDDGVMAA